MIVMQMQIHSLTVLVGSALLLYCCRFMLMTSQRLSDLLGEILGRGSKQQLQFYSLGGPAEREGKEPHQVKHIKRSVTMNMALSQKRKI